MFLISTRQFSFQVTMAEPSYTLLKNVCTYLSSQTAIWVYLKKFKSKSNGPKQSLTQFSLNKRNQLVGPVLDQLLTFFKSNLHSCIFVIAQNTLFKKRSTTVVFSAYSLSSLKNLILNDWERDYTCLYWCSINWQNWQNPHLKKFSTTGVVSFQ